MSAAEPTDKQSAARLEELWRIARAGGEPAVAMVTELVRGLGAEPWRSDEPPEGTRVELRHRSGWIAEGVFTTSYRNGDLHRMLNGVSVATDFENLRWRAAGPNPFEQEKT